MSEYSESESRLAISLDLKDLPRTAMICNALSSAVRLEILKTLIDHAASISELADQFQLPMSSMCMHVKKLKEAGLIIITPKPGIHRNQKLCALHASSVGLDLYAHLNASVRKKAAFVEIPVGDYCSCEITPPCGLASVSSFLNLHEEDSPYGFYEPNHTEASLLWMTSGYLEYSFSNKALQDDDVSSVEFSFEICAEAPDYREDWPSDITFGLNGKKIATIHVKGDYGDRRGTYNPEWWPKHITQHGEYVCIRMKKDGIYLNNSLVSRETIDSLGMRDGYSFKMLLGVDPNAEHVGGMNLFGKYFGDYSQDIIMKVEYE